MSTALDHLLNGRDDLTGQLQRRASETKAKILDLLGGASLPAEADASWPPEMLELYADLERTQEEIARRNSRRCSMQLTAALADTDRDAADEAALARWWWDRY